jgi:hypothetical protein
MAQQVLEGTWEEIAIHADELTGKRLTVIVEADEAAGRMDIPVVGPPNEGMLNILQEIAERQKNRRETYGGDTVQIIRHGRSGPMYGMEYVED